MFKLIDGGPEFEVLRTHRAGTPPSDKCTCVAAMIGGYKCTCPPTYEQAVVHMFRTATGIMKVGKQLQVDYRLAQLHYHNASERLRRFREGRKGVNLPKHLVRYCEQEVLRKLDELWLAQEKYNAWARTYGDL